MPTTIKKTTTIRKGRVRARLPMGRRQVRRPLMARFPTFTETLVRPAKIVGNAGGVFSVSIDELPQLAQYSRLYRQYKINWAKITLITDNNSFDTATAPLATAAMPRIAWAVNDTPNTAPPINESDLLTSNGARFKPLVTTWSQSFKPVPDVGMANVGTGALIPVRAPRSMFLNFAAAGTPNPEMYGISYWISQVLAGGALPNGFNVYVKINFSLRDPL